MIKKLVCASIFTGTLAVIVAHAVLASPTPTLAEPLVPAGDDDSAGDEDHARPVRWGRKVEVIEIDGHGESPDDAPAGEPPRERNQKKSKASGKRADRVWD